jgi:hypothetical protein
MIVTQKCIYFRLCSPFISKCRSDYVRFRVVYGAVRDELLRLAAVCSIVDPVKGSWLTGLQGLQCNTHILSSATKHQPLNYSHVFACLCATLFKSRVF